MAQSQILAVPTNLITGFLGAGKTTAILHLLRHKPSSERWAVLVNEFGEVGVDGSLLQGQHTEKHGVFVREVPGGCMCCAAGLPMQIALNQLLTRAKPHRLIIEPTGLGHPKEVLQVLSADHYQHILDLQQCLTLVDARKIADPRYTNHATFNQQIEMADQIIGSKADLYGSLEQENLRQYVANRKGGAPPVFFSRSGDLALSRLTGKSGVAKNLKRAQHVHGLTTGKSIESPALPECGFLRVENAGEGYRSVGWRFSPEKTFKRHALFAWLCGLKVERAKAVFITSEGAYGYNISADTLTEVALDECEESRIEVIGFEIHHIREDDLLECMES